MFSIKKHLFIIAATATLFSCKNDLELNAPYKEFPSIYAVLSPQDKIQMIRINKVFLGEGDANAMAQISDSINYPAGELTVMLERFVNGVKTTATPTGNKTEIVFRDSVITAQPGAFNPSQRIYVSADKLFTDGIYKLTVTNNKTKNVFTASASSLDSVKLSGYTPLCNPTYPIDPPNNDFKDNRDWYIDYSSPTGKYNVKYLPLSTPSNVAIYQLTMRLHYIDSMIAGPNQYKYVDFNFGRQNKSEATRIGNLGPYMINNFTGSEIYSAVANALAGNSTPVSSIVGRRMYMSEFFVYASTQEYLDYLQFAAPSLSIAQDKPLYSNFDGRKALGLFTFRSRLSVRKEMSAEYKSQFAFNSATCKYKFFQIPQLIIPFCK